MATTPSTYSDDTPKFRSPKRALARSFFLSRNRWKEKAEQRGKRIKALQIRVRDLEVSRDLWKTKARHLQEQIGHLPTLSPTPLVDDLPVATESDLVTVTSSQNTATTDLAAPEPFQPTDPIDSSFLKQAPITTPAATAEAGSEVKKNATAAESSP